MYVWPTNSFSSVSACRHNPTLPISGNIKFRNLVLEYREAYRKASKIEKPNVARELGKLVVANSIHLEVVA